MKITVTLNGEKISREIDPGLTLYDFVRGEGCLSVKCSCESSSCGLCTVFVEDVPVLSCSMLAARADGRRVDTLEGLREEALSFVGFLADRGADQCGFCNPGMVMNTIALLRENTDPSREDVKAYLAGNLCRCTGYESQVDGIMSYLDWRKHRQEKGETDV